MSAYINELTKQAYFFGRYVYSIFYDLKIPPPDNSEINTRLSDEILFIIFSRLKSQDLIKIKRVCRRWNNLTQAPILWQSLDFSGSKITDIVLVKLIKLYPNFKYLNLEHCGKITNISLKQIAKSCPFLEYINLSFCKTSEDYIIQIIIHCFRLRDIIITTSTLPRIVVTIIHRRPLIMPFISLSSGSNVPNSFKKKRHYVIKPH